MSKIVNFMNSYSGKKLLEDHKLDDYGVWEVYGEDPNCDSGGSHVKPFLGSYSGTLASVLVMAVDLPRFWTWGGGGTIELAINKKIKPLLNHEEAMYEIRTAQSRKQDLDNEAAKIEEEINRLKTRLSDLKG